MGVSISKPSSSSVIANGNAEETSVLEQSALCKMIECQRNIFDDMVPKDNVFERNQSSINDLIEAMRNTKVEPEEFESKIHTKLIRINQSIAGRAASMKIVKTMIEGTRRIVNSLGPNGINKDEFDRFKESEALYDENVKRLMLEAQIADLIKEEVKLLTNRK